MNTVKSEQEIAEMLAELKLATVQYELSIFGPDAWEAFKVALSHCETVDGGESETAAEYNELVTMWIARNNPEDFKMETVLNAVDGLRKKAREYAQEFTAERRAELRIDA